MVEWQPLLFLGILHKNYPIAQEFSIYPLDKSELFFSLQPATASRVAGAPISAMSTPSPLCSSPYEWASLTPLSQSYPVSPSLPRSLTHSPSPPSPSPFLSNRAVPEFPTKFSRFQRAIAARSVFVFQCIPRLLLGRTLFTQHPVSRRFPRAPSVSRLAHPQLESLALCYITHSVYHFRLPLRQF